MNDETYADACSSPEEHRRVLRSFQGSDDETVYLLSSPANAERLMDALACTGFHQDDEPQCPVCEPDCEKCRPDEDLVCGDLYRDALEGCTEELNENARLRRILENTSAEILRSQAEEVEKRIENARLRATIDRVREYAESRCTEEHMNYASASWVLHILDGTDDADVQGKEV